MDGALGIDLGSSGCKAAVVDAEGRVAGTGATEYATHRPAPGAAEQDPEDWVRAAFAASRMAAAAAPGVNVRAVACVGVTHNAVLYGPDGKALRRAIILFDTRSSAVASDIGGRFGTDIARRTGNAMSPMWTWPQLEWLRRTEPDLFRGIAAIAFTKDHVRDALTGQRPGLTDRIDAQGTALFDPSAGWVEPFLGDLGLPRSGWPVAREPWDIAGGLAPSAAAEIGVPAGTPVLVGTTDTAAEMLGAGAASAGDGVAKLASVGRLAAIATSPCTGPGIVSYAWLADGLHYPGTATKFASSAFAWLSRLAFAGVTEAAAAAETVPAGADGLIFLPYLDGEWAPHFDDTLRAAFIGLTIRHGRAHMARAVMEGVALAMRAALSQARRAGLRADRLSLIGGGANSLIWRQIMADALGRPLAVPAARDAAFGAALMAGAVAGVLPRPLDALAEVARQGAAQVQPGGDSALYDRLASVHAEAAEAMQPISRRLSGLEPELKDTAA